MNFEIAPKETEIQASWNDAKLYCFSLNIDGKVGWRLPTKDELNQIYESENDFRKEWEWYWSSTELDGSYAWIQFIDDGSQNYFRKNGGGTYVRAIRDLT